MEELNLPISKDFPESNRWLPMNEYIKFINFMAANFSRWKGTKKDEINMHVNIPFRIK
jgi:hypothetical protein